ncbi:MAG: 23S rRNA (guanosine(2251)-2'-O)-methyltransferase RlmB [Epsilonproteobacteria bacterium]|nr:23S rRNA (guanosine(2251)-2'-O)-methyltransferase RlmB [Campylobacterota bacterium]
MIVYGKRIFYYILQNHIDVVNEIILAKKLETKEFHKLQKLNIPIKIVDNKKAQSLARGGNHQGYFLDISFSPKEIDLSNSKHLIVLDNVTDMGNIGAIVRSAYCFGVDGVIITGINAIKWDSIIRMSAGCAIDMPIANIKNILDIINELKTKGYKIIGADRGAKSTITKSHKMALVVGNEQNGISKRVKAKLDEVISIEMKREFDSLNVSVASAILMDRIFNG